MQSVKIRDMETEESIWLNIPSSHQMVKEAFAGLGEPEMVQIVSVERRDPVLDKHLEGKMPRRENGLNGRDVNAAGRVAGVMVYRFQERKVKQ